MISFFLSIIMAKLVGLQTTYMFYTFLFFFINFCLELVHGDQFGGADISTSVDEEDKAEKDQQNKDKRRCNSSALLVFNK